MIWNDPWIAAATDQTQEGTCRPFCTTLPPPAPPTLPEGIRFSVVVGTAAADAAWADFVGTRWTPAELQERLADAHVALLCRDSTIVGTCVLRRRPHRDLMENFWILETLRAQHGLGAPLMRYAVRWLWDRCGPFVLAYTWELRLAQLCAAWWRGWLRSAAAIEWGWVWGGSTDCSFCPHAAEPWQRIISERLTMPTSFCGGNWVAVVSDSGLGDGWGIVSAWSGAVDWASVCQKGGWRNLWCRSKTAPESGSAAGIHGITGSWKWSGDAVVVGMLNFCRVGVQDVAIQAMCQWVTAEI